MATQQDVLSQLITKVAEFSDGEFTVDDIDPDIDVVDAGYVDSLRLVLVAAFVEERYQHELSNAELNEARTLREISRSIAEHEPRASTGHV
jgi:acyl carrier protein